MNNLKKTKDFLEKVKLQIDLHDYLEVKDSCRYNHFEQFCPILLKLGPKYNEKLTDTNGDEYNEDTTY
jgi:hypothetical protein